MLYFLLYLSIGFFIAAALYTLVPYKKSPIEEFFIGIFTAVIWPAILSYGLYLHFKRDQFEGY